MSDFITQEIRFWTGVRLDRERTDLELDELAYALNADLFLEPGVIRSRRGSSKLTTTALADLIIRRIHRINSTRYQVASNTLYRAAASVHDYACTSTIDQPATVLGTLAAKITTDTTVSADYQVIYAWEKQHVEGTTISAVTGYTVCFSWEASHASVNQTWTWQADPAGLHSSEVTSIQPYRPLNDTSTWAFIADASGMRKDDGTNLRNWGIAAPAAAPTLGTTGTGLTGDYIAVYTYVRKVGSNVIAESNASPAPSAQTLTNQNLTVAVKKSTDPQVTNIRVYRTVADGASYLYDQEVSNADLTVTSSQADSALGSEVETDNDVPPDAGWVSPHDDGRFWITQDPDFPHYVYYSKRFRPEAVPAANYLEITTPEDPVQCVIPFGGIRIAFCKARKYRIIGTGAGPFVPQETPSKRGTTSWAAVAAGEDGIYFLARDGIFRTNGFAPDEQIAGPILPLFKDQSVNGYSAINWDQAAKFVLTIFEGTLYVSWADGTNTNPNILWINKIGTTKWIAWQYGTGVSALHYEEDTGNLTAGGQDGFVYQLETGSNDAGSDIALTADSKDYAHVLPESPGGPLARHLFRFIREDVEGGTISTLFYADGTLKHTASVSTTRRPSPIALPSDAQGYRWRKRWTYTGTGTAKIYATSVQALPLEREGNG